MHAEIISIGDELTSGQRLDTNSQWLSEQLGDLGIEVAFHTTVGDDLARNIEVFRAAAARADIVVASGGLGPTADDLTREAMAQAAGVGLALDEASLEQIRRIFARRERPMPERNVAQAMFPEGSTPIPNPEGTAPGIHQVIRRGDHECRLFALPGVPAEMKQMWQATVAPEITRLTGRQQTIARRCIRCFGAGESDVEQMLPDIIRRGRSPTVGITVSGATITLRITAVGRDADECRALIAPTETTIRECLGSLVFGEEEDELQHAIVRRLAERGETLATCEVGSRGLMARWLAEVDPDGSVFRAGLTVGDPAAAPEWRMAPDWPGGAALTGPELAAWLARRVQRQFGATHGLALGAFPFRPEAVGRQTDPAETHFAWASPTITEVRAATMAGHSSIVEARVAKTALNFLRLGIT